MNNHRSHADIPKKRMSSLTESILGYVLAVAIGVALAFIAFTNL